MMFCFMNMQVNPNYTSTFIFDNDFPTMVDSIPAPGKYVKSVLNYVYHIGYVLSII